MTAKESILDILNQTPPDATYEQILYSIYVREKIELGLRAVAEGDIATDAEVDQEMARWELK